MTDTVRSLIPGFQLGQGSTYQPGRGGQEDNEAIQHSCPLEAHIPRAETAETSSTRECRSWESVFKPDMTDVGKVISLSDIFISPLEDM